MFELQQRFNPRYFPWFLENDWVPVSLHPTEEHAIIHKLDHEKRSVSYEYQVIPTTKET